MGFFLFILVNAALFIRPGEVVPALLSLPIYNVLILGCLACSAPQVLGQLTGRSLAESPITACVLGMLLAIVLSLLIRFNLLGAWTWANDFFKVILYYLLLVGQLTTLARLRRFLVCLVGFTAVLTVLALAQFHGYAEIPSITVLEEIAYDPATGDEIITPRLRSTGIYSDPNDLSLILVTAMVICLYKLGPGGGGLSRPIWLALLAMFGYALIQTKSRGGLIALMAALMTLFHARFGWKKAAALGMIMLPAMLMVAGKRQSSISTGEGTSQERIQFWSLGLTLLPRSPLFGIGVDNYVEEVGHVAHNSFVHAYVELGFFGGTIFLGAFWLAATSLRRVALAGEVLDADLRRMSPYLLAMVVGYAAGMLSLSRNYIVPTYMVLGIAASFDKIVSVFRGPALRLDTTLVRRLVAVSAASLAVIYLFVRLTVRW